MTLSDKLYKILIQGGSWKTIMGGLGVTIQISFFALLLGTVLGALVCLLRTRKNTVIRSIASVYIAVLRGTPVLMLLLLLYYGVLARAGLKPVTVATLTFALNVSAHVAELLRSALEAADRGQAEAALCRAQRALRNGFRRRHLSGRIGQIRTRGDGRKR